MELLRTKTSLAVRDRFLARNNCAATRFAPPLRARRQTAAHKSRPRGLSAELEPGFRSMDRSLSRRPRGGCEARVLCGTALCGMRVRTAFAHDDGCRLAPRLLGGFRPRGARFVWPLIGDDGSLAVLPLRLCVRGVRGARRGRADGEAGVLADLWGSCGSDDAGAWAGTLPCVEDQSGVDASVGRLPRSRCRRGPL